MRLTTRLLRYEFRYWKNYIERNLYKQDSKEVYQRGIGWFVKRRRKEDFHYDENRPWTEQFQRNNTYPLRGRLPKVYVEPIKEWTIFKGDRVEILVGKDKRKQGVVNSIIKERNWVYVEGLNCEYKMQESIRDSPPVCIKSELPLLVTTQVKLVDPSDEKPTDVEWRYTEEGKRVRVSTRSGRIIVMPTETDEWEDFVLPKTYMESSKDTTDKEVKKVTFKPELLSFEDDIMQEMEIKEDRKREKTYWY